jgi:peptide/nickel transport system permease protein
LNYKPTSLSKLAYKKFIKNKVGIISFWYIVLCGIIAVFAYTFAPDNSPNGNTMHLEIHTKKPLFKTKILHESKQQKEKQSVINKLFFGDKNTTLETPINNATIVNDTLIIDLYSESKNISKQKKVPINTSSKEHQKLFIKNKTFYLGTDKYGRDLLSRMLIGTRISFFIGFIAVFISLVIGISIGSIAGYFGGKIDKFIMWLINVTWSIPTLLMVIAITLALGKGFWQY